MKFLTFKAVVASAALIPAVLVSSNSSAEITLDQCQGAIVVEQEIKGVTSEMLDWWWDNIDTTERFGLWHPDHIAFEWLVPPSNPNHLDYSVGATQLITEVIAGHSVNSKVTWLDPLEAQACVSYDHWIVTQVDFTDYEGESDLGWVLHEYQVNELGDGIVLRSTLIFSESANAIYPGYVDGLVMHVEQEMQNLPDFLPELFQQEFIDDELLTRGSYEVFRSGWFVKTVVVDQEIHGMTPDMLDWWWDNINTTKRYKQWHPTAHVSFEWLEAPSNPDQLAYSVGAVQAVTEYLGKYKSKLAITWLDPFEVKDEVVYDHWMYAKTELQALRGVFPQTLIHEYTLNDAGDGMLMRSTFTIPGFFDLVMPGFSKELGKHAQQEMQFLQYFLPELYQKEYLNEGL